MNTTIYRPTIILSTYNIERNWYKSLGLNEDEQANKVMLFVIKDGKIKSTKLVKRALIINYKPRNNEYYLDRVRDTGDVITDYNLEPVQKLVNMYNGLYQKYFNQNVYKIYKRKDYDMIKVTYYIGMNDKDTLK